MSSSLEKENENVCEQIDKIFKEVLELYTETDEIDAEVKLSEQELKKLWLDIENLPNGIFEFVLLMIEKLDGINLPKGPQCQSHLLQLKPSTLLALKDYIDHVGQEKETKQNTDVKTD